MLVYNIFVLLLSPDVSQPFSSVGVAFQMLRLRFQADIQPSTVRIVGLKYILQIQAIPKVNQKN